MQEYYIFCEGELAVEIVKFIVNYYDLKPIIKSVNKLKRNTISSKEDVVQIEKQCKSTLHHNDSYKKAIYNSLQKDDNINEKDIEKTIVIIIDDSSIKDKSIDKTKLGKKDNIIYFIPKPSIEEILMLLLNPSVKVLLEETKAKKQVEKAMQDLKIPYKIKYKPKNTAYILSKVPKENWSIFIKNKKIKFIKFIHKLIAENK